MNRNRRALVLTDESARHPFRQALPPHIRGGSARAVTARPGWMRIDASDWKSFFAAYCAAFLAVTIFIS